MRPEQIPIPDKRCKLCPLGVERDRRRGQVIRGRGPKAALIAIVGQGGGADEELSGKPFVGPAGRRLQQQLIQSGLDVNSVFFTNVVMCRPPNNRVPTNQEMKICSRFVHFELTKIVRPKWIIAAGAVALKYFGGKGTITDSVGHPVRLNKYCCVMPIFHPSSFLYKESPANEERNVNALIYVRNALQGRSPDAPLKTRCMVCQNITDIAEWSDKILVEASDPGGCYVSVDTETSDLHFKRGRILCVSTSISDGQGDVVPLRGEKGAECWSPKDYKKIIGIVRRTLTADGVHIIGANFKFDSLFLRTEDIDCWADIDVELAHHLLDENSAHGLSDLSYFVGMGGYKKILKPYLPRRNTRYTEIPLETLWYYAALDADCARRLWFWRFKDELENDGRLLWLFRHVVMPIQRVLTDVEYRGIAVDMKYLDQLRRQYVRRLDKMERHFQSLTEVRAATNKINRIRKRKGLKPLTRLNFQSGEHLRTLLFDVLQLKPIKLTKTGLASIDRMSLQHLAGAPISSADDEFTNDDVAYLTEKPASTGSVMNSLLEYRALSKLLSTYIDGLEEKTVGGIIHTSFLIAGTVSGRASSRGPNLQNQPGEKSGYRKEIRDLFVARPGYRFAELDYKQAEIRCWAHYSQDPILLADLAAGVDIHREISGQVYGIPTAQVTDQQRQIVKATVFGTMYGRGARAISAEFGITEDESRRIQQMIFQRYPTASAWINYIQGFAKANGYVRNAFGRIRHLGLLKRIRMDKYGNPIGLSKDEFRAYVHTLNEAINTPIQGLQAEITWVGMIRNWEAFRRHRLDAHIVLTVHDCQLIEYRASQERKVLPLAIKTMEADIPGVRVPLKVDVSVGRTWGSVSKYKR